MGRRTLVDLTDSLYARNPPLATSLGQAVIDQGGPLAPGSATISSDGSVTDSGASPLTGHTIVSAESLAEATEKARGCLVLATAVQSRSTRRWRPAEATGG
jgi:hypothetical protein